MCTRGFWERDWKMETNGMELKYGKYSGEKYEETKERKIGRRRNERTTDGVGNKGTWPKFCSALHHLSCFVLNVCYTQTCTLQSVSCQHSPSVQFADSPQTRDQHPSWLHKNEAFSCKCLLRDHYITLRVIFRWHVYCP
jgi:hypothetical protein